MISNDYDKLIKNLFEGVYIVDPNRKILFWNKGSEAITGYLKEEVVDSYCFNNILQHVDQEGNSLCFNGCPLHQTLVTGEQFENEVFLKHKRGHRVPVTVRTVPIYDENKKVVAAIEVFSDNRYREDLFSENKRLQEIVVTDELTRISNRRYMEFQLTSATQEAQQFHQPFGVLFIDIDHFKLVNDQYGHNVGDDVLQLVARTIDSNIRENDVFSRWGGEEFLLLTKGITKKALLKLSEKLRVLVKNSQLTDESGNIISVTISLGGTIYNEPESVEELIARADQFMYEAKRNGRNQTIIK